MPSIAECLTFEEEKHRRHFEIAASTNSPVPINLADRGIVICAGGERYLTCAWVCINQLRRVGCRLPIELWHFEGEVTPLWQQVIAPLGVKFVNATSRLAQQPTKPRGGWELKAFSLVFNGFRESLLLDADNVVVKDPTSLFDDLGYLKHGSIFWPDRNSVMWNPRVWDVCGIPRREEPEFESGQIVVDKVRCWRELQLALYMNEQSAFFYRYLYGDKDTFRFAWHKIGREFAMPSKLPENRVQFILQHDIQDNQLFQHRVEHKWSLEGNRRMGDFWFEEECLSMIDNLRDRLDYRRRSRLRPKLRNAAGLRF